MSRQLADKCSMHELQASLLTREGHHALGGVRKNIDSACARSKAGHTSTKRPYANLHVPNKKWQCFRGNDQVWATYRMSISSPQGVVSWLRENDHSGFRVSSSISAADALAGDERLKLCTVSSPIEFTPISLRSQRKSVSVKVTTFGAGCFGT